MGWGGCAKSLVSMSEEKGGGGKGSYKLRLYKRRGSAGTDSQNALPVVAYTSFKSACLPERLHVCIAVGAACWRVPACQWRAKAV